MNQRININDMVADRMAAHSINLFRFDAGLRRRLRRVLSQQVRQELIAHLNRTDPTALQKAAYRERRADTLSEEARKIARAGYRAVANAHERAMRDLAGIEEEFARLAVNRTVGTNIATISVPDARLREIARTTLIDGAPSRDWWAGQAEDVRKVFERTVRTGLRQGDSIGDMTRLVAQQIDGRFSQAEALTRTSVMAVANAAHQESFQANADIVRGVQVLVTWDNRTSKTCVALGVANAAWDFEGNPLPDSGWKHPQPPGPPFHWNCRTILTPVLGAVEDLVGEVGEQKSSRIEALPKEMHDAMDGQIAAMLPGERWLKSKSDSFADELLGKTRAQLWRDGKVRISQLVDQSARPLTLDQLKEKVRGVTDTAIEQARAA